MIEFESRGDVLSTDYSNEKDELAFVQQATKQAATPAMGNEAQQAFEAAAPDDVLCGPNVKCQNGAIQIIADSCCDVTPAIAKTMGIQRVPLTITVDGDTHYVDDENLNPAQLLAALKATKKPIATAAPSPEAYASLMRKAPASIVITLSQKLSGSYNAAIAGKQIVLEEFPDKKITVLDSKTASAGELRIALELYWKISKGMTYEDICEHMFKFIGQMRTLFVLEDLSTLIKNGRIPKMAGIIGTMLMLRPIMGANEEGEIIPIEKMRGTQNALNRLVAIVAERTKLVKPKTFVLALSYCNAPERASMLKKQILKLCPAIKEVIIAPTSGLSTSYANDGGIVLAYG